MDGEILDRTSPSDTNTRKLMSPNDIAAALHAAKRELGEDCPRDRLVAATLMRLKRERPTVSWTLGPADL